MSVLDRINGLNQGVAYKAPVRVATTANITLSGAQTIDGVAVVADDRVLVKDQTDQTQNGIYIASDSGWSRSADFDGNRDVTEGTMFIVLYGSTSAGWFYKLTTTSDPVVFGTDNITFEIVLDMSAISAITAFGVSLISASNASEVNTLLGLVIGTDVQAYDATLTALASALTAANKIPYATGLDTLGELDFIASDTFAGASTTSLNAASNTKTYIDTEVASVASQRYISAEQTITSSGPLTLTHGLTVTNPHTISLRYHLVCQTAEYGYSVGDIVPIDFNMSSLGNNHYSMAVLNTTEINIRYSSDASVFNAGNFTTGAVEAFTNANWKLVVVAEIVK